MHFILSFLTQKCELMPHTKKHFYTQFSDYKFVPLSLVLFRLLYSCISNSNSVYHFINSLCSATGSCNTALTRSVQRVLLSPR